MLSLKLRVMLLWCWGVSHNTRGPVQLIRLSAVRKCSLRIMPAATLKMKKYVNNWSCLAFQTGPVKLSGWWQHFHIKGCWNTKWAPQGICDGGGGGGGGVVVADRSMGGQDFGFLGYQSCFEISWFIQEKIMSHKEYFRYVPWWSWLRLFVFLLRSLPQNLFQGPPAIKYQMLILTKTYLVPVGLNSLMSVLWFMF